MIRLPLRSRINQRIRSTIQHKKNTVMLHNVLQEATQICNKRHSLEMRTGKMCVNGTIMSSLWLCCQHHFRRFSKADCVNVLINKISRRQDFISQLHRYLLYHGCFTMKRRQGEWQKHFSIFNLTGGACKIKKFDDISE